MSTRKLLLVGWDAADWAMINPLIDRGEMPHLQRLIDTGVLGYLATMDPPLSPLLWTSIATGKTADQHGILGFLEPDPASGGVRPATSTSRRCKAIWNVLNQNGLRPHVVNWFASHPAEPLAGVSVSNAFVHSAGPLPPGAVHPSHLEAALAPLRITPADLTGEDLALFVPHIARVDQHADHRLVTLARVIAEGMTAHAVATWILERESWDFLAVYLDTIDHAGHDFMAYHPPKMPEVSDADFEIYQHVMTGVYRMHDLMLGRLMQLAGPDVTVMVVSDHGFSTGAARPSVRSAIPIETPMLWHRRHGVFCLAGPGIRKDELVHGAGLLDIAPTILTLFDLSRADDMPGRPLFEAFEARPDFGRIASWDAVRGPDGMHAEDVRADPWEADAAVEQLAALGYIEAPADDAEKLRVGAVQHQRLNLARVHIAGGRSAEAIPLLEALVAEYPGLPGLQRYLGQAYFRAGQYERSERIAAELLKTADSLFAEILRANSAIFRKDTEMAAHHLAVVEARNPTDPDALILIAQAYLLLGRLDDAARHYSRTLEIDARSAAAFRGLATVRLQQREFRDAADLALDAVGLDYAHPGGHFLLGVALAMGGSGDRAIQAFETCLQLRPTAAVAHRWLEQLHAHVTGDVERARHHRSQAEEIARSTGRASPAVAHDGV